MKYTREILSAAVEKSTSVAGVLRELGLKQSGGTQSHVKSCILKFNIDMPHFTGQAHNKGKTSPKKLRPEQVLVVDRLNGRKEPARVLRRVMFECGIEHVCFECSNPPEWMGEGLVLEIHHLNGEWWDNRIENLQFLCPNCHSQK